MLLLMLMLLVQLSKRGLRSDHQIYLRSGDELKKFFNCPLML